MGDLRSWDVPLAEIDNTGLGPEVEAANARLIAAAPKMYDYIKGRAEDGEPIARQLLEEIDEAAGRDFTSLPGSRER